MTVGGAHSDIPHEFSVSLPRENVVNALFASPVERMRDCVLSGTEKRVQECKLVICRG